MVEYLSLGRRMRQQKKGKVSNVRENNDFGNMGEIGLKSHAKSEKHVRNSKSTDNGSTLSVEKVNTSKTKSEYMVASHLSFWILYTCMYM